VNKKYGGRRKSERGIWAIDLRRKPETDAKLGGFRSNKGRVKGRGNKGRAGWGDSQELKQISIETGEEKEEGFASPKNCLREFGGVESSGAAV